MSCVLCACCLLLGVLVVCSLFLLCVVDCLFDVCCVLVVGDVLLLEVCRSLVVG